MTRSSPKRGYRRPTNSPLYPYTLEYGSDIRRMKGCFVQILNICKEHGDLEHVYHTIDLCRDRILEALKADYEARKIKLIDQGIYPVKGYFKSYTKGKKLNDNPK